ncbi:phosphoribosyltransferase [Flaviramulus sp. BrNp1-15]|uniref:phosphoribosyltransferase n=1 Tax=Flaviramulus sp. BrNp1-15 TaxID=2916754 RepID=UPI001EE7D8B1|nr:phosphoribosyltransferase family protein [Flaviramulus sp. BrNp1-15]ULC57898.1 phosphoribosyltransferase [Flaviramulus sp. BrNp1-15]
MFNDRIDAGLLLAEELKNYSDNKNAVIITIPRGGLPIGNTIAKQLHLPLELVLSKKIGHPINKEFAIGAVTLSDSILSDDANLVSKEYLNEETYKIRTLLKERHNRYYGTKKPLNLKNKIVILVDDGVATGHTLISSIKLIEKQKPSHIVVALPVGSPSAIEKIKKLPYVNETICLLKPSNFHAVGQFYNNFNQVSDDEVVRLLKEANNNLQVNI